ncbi:DUF2645 family protein [Pectobacterium brasiliense]|uniref:DUF2645 family protein n=1 Tax=Pectobacterium brasiliense TaxID=180957 RepID=UPI0030C83113
MEEKSLLFHLRRNNSTLLENSIKKYKSGTLKMLRKTGYIYNVYFYTYSALCFFLINAFSTIEYEWMIDGDSVADFCEVPRADADGFLSIIIVPLSIPFLLVRRTPLRIFTYLTILMYHSYRFYTRISVCSIAN